MSYRKKVFKRIYDYVKTNYTKVDINNFILGEINYTFRCHLNAVQKYKENKATKVYLCVAINKDKEPVAHFINGTVDGKYQDNTWGWLYTDYDYYIVKEINENEFDNIGGILMSTKRSLVYNNSNMFFNFIHGINKDKFI